MVLDFLKKYWFQLLIIIALIVIATIIINNGKKPKSINTAGGFTPSADTAGLDKNKVLSKGMSGPEVKQLQKYINQAIILNGGTTQISEDGVFGTLTETMLHNLTNQWSISLNDAEFMLANYNN